jgi:hypothetical protein
MATLDIREGEDKRIDVIRFASEDPDFDNAVESKSGPASMLRICDGTSSITIVVKDIPKMLKALQKAQEVWKD